MLAGSVPRRAIRKGGTAHAARVRYVLCMSALQVDEASRRPPAAAASRLRAAPGPSGSSAAGPRSGLVPSMPPSQRQLGGGSVHIEVGAPPLPPPAPAPPSRPAFRPEQIAVLVLGAAALLGVEVGILIICANALNAVCECRLACMLFFLA